MGATRQSIARGRDGTFIPQEKMQLNIPFSPPPPSTVELATTGAPNNALDKPRGRLIVETARLS